MFSPSEDTDAPVGSGLGLGYRLGVDTAVGLLAGFSLSYFITPMDQAVIQQMSGKATMGQSLRTSGLHILSNPVSYACTPQFYYVVGTYMGTYLSKNYIDTMSKEAKLSPESTAALQFWGVLAVNGGLSVFWKDPGLAKLFGSQAAAMPKTTYAAWMLRDSLHMLGAVVLPDYLEAKFGLTKDQWRVAQVACPMGVQLLTTPWHLLGLDLYNVSESSNGDRARRIFKAWLPSSGIRMVRMFAPWSLGLLINRDLREWALQEHTYH